MFLLVQIMKSFLLSTYFVHQPLLLLDKMYFPYWKERENSLVIFQTYFNAMVNKFIKQVTVTLSLLGLSLTVLAQSPLLDQVRKGRFSIHGGLAIPTGGFAADAHKTYDLSNRAELGRAGIGFLIGGKYLYSINDNGLDLFLTADFLFNRSKKSARWELEQLVIEELGSDANYTIKTPNFFSLPIIGGLRYHYPIQEKLAIYGDVGVGFSVIKRSDVVLSVASYHNHDYEVIWKSQPSTKFSYLMGVGFLINKRYSLGVQYTALGDHSFRETISTLVSVSGTTDEIVENSLEKRLGVIQNMGVFNFTLGVPLKF